MFRPDRNKLAVKIVVFALVFSIPVRTTLNAADPEALPSHGPRSLAENLFHHARELMRELHARPLEERSMSDYSRALDAFGQVIRLNTDSFSSAESLARMAELQREMADATGDSEVYQQAVETLRRIVANHPQSNFVGDALINIAQIYEENLQDLDGAATAYRELIAYFPSSVMAREARAVLTRFEAQLLGRPVDVEVSPDKLAGGRIGLPGAARLTNVRSFSGPDYTRLVIDLSDQAIYSPVQTDGSRLSIRLQNAVVSSSLYGRRFILNESGLLRRVTVKEEGRARATGESALMNGLRYTDSLATPVAGSTTVEINIDLRTASDYSIFRLSGPERIVIDVHAAGALTKPAPVRAHSIDEPVEAVDSTTASSTAAPATGESVKRADLVARNRKPVASDMRGAILSLPEITDPILPFNPADKGATATAAIDAKREDAPIKCVVIDPGHGGHDTGTIGGSGLREKDLVLDVARRLRAYIKRNFPDVEVILTRDSDRFVALEERTAIANARRADLFISIHANASESRAASGVETYFLSPDRASAEDMKAAQRENARLGSEKSGEATADGQASKTGQVAKKAEPASQIVTSVSAGNRVAESRELARYIQSGLVRGIGAASPRTAANRGVKHAPFTVLLGASMPSVLAEVSFMSNPRDEALLLTGHFRERIAASLFAGVNAFLKKHRSSEAKAKTEAKAK